MQKCIHISDNEVELIEHMKQYKNQSAYIVGLIKKDMTHQAEESELKAIRHMLEEVLSRGVAVAPSKPLEEVAIDQDAVLSILNI